MSRSFKHYPICIQEEKDTHAGNRKLRHAKLLDVANGGAFKKFGVGWLGAYYYSWEEAKEDYKNTPRLQKMFTPQEWRHYYLRVTTRK